MTDAELVRRARDGQPTAREQLARRYAPRLLAVCRARIGRRDSADDLAQEALIRGLKCLDSLKEPEKLGAWLRGIAIRVCLDWLRAQSREHVSMSVLGETDESQRDIDPGDNTPAPGSRIERQEQHEQLQRAIDGLSGDLREPLLLFYYDEMTYDQIAEMLGVSRATVNTRLAGARAQLARQLAHLMR